MPISIIQKTSYKTDSITKKKNRESKKNDRDWDLEMKGTKGMVKHYVLLAKFKEGPIWWNWETDQTV
jgi:hypothetical protein